METLHQDNIDSPLISPLDLKLIRLNPDLVLIDASAGPNAKANYLENHLVGAQFIDLNIDLAKIEKDVAKGGRHPLPKVSDFVASLENLGISQSTHVVIYDNKNGALAAARLWWMLKAIGHERVQVLNGGFQAAISIDFPTTYRIEKTETVTYQGASNWQLPLAYIGDVDAAIDNRDKCIIDVREAGRYLGEFETIDLVAGHIPTAINIPFSENLDENGLFLIGEKLQKKYQKIFKNHNASNITVHCGSGVTACHTLLALASAGFDLPKLYVGSWSEWSRNGQEIIVES